MTSPETTENGLFEGLFVRALDAQGPLEQELRERGFDRRRPRARYTSQVFRDCLEVARRHRYPDLTPAEGLRALGRDFIAGFRQTILGSVMTAALPLLGPRSMLTKVPARLQRLRSDMIVTVEQRSPDDFVLTAQDPQPVGDFFVGALEAGLRLAGAHGATVTSMARPGGWTSTVSLKP